MSDFNGRTITGEVGQYVTPLPPQDDPQLFLDALDVILAVPGVESVRWSQYTPYFNDGDPCVFGTRAVYVRIAGDDTEVGDYGDGFRSSYELYDYDTATHQRVFAEKVAGFDARPIHDALTAFELVLDSNRHLIVLGEKFGDPAQVTATPAGFDVEFYEHD